jgi:hypothetical protein
VSAPALTKWSVVMVWCKNLSPPHDKFCICVCPRRHWFLFINSKPPRTARARAVAIEVENFELHFLDHGSFIDTTVVHRLPAEDILMAWSDEHRRKGNIPPSLRQRIQAAAQSHGVLTADELDAILH